MPEVERFYARQSRLIDEGDARGWAATFTPDGVFDSPSYPQPARGAEELEAFARGFRDNGIATATRMRHVITNVDVVTETPDAATVHAYLQIVATPQGHDSRLVRLTTITDQLVRRPDAEAGAGGWLVAHRAVRRDDAAPSSHPTTAEPAEGVTA